MTPPDQQQQQNEQIQQLTNRVKELEYLCNNLADSNVILAKGLHQMTTACESLSDEIKRLKTSPNVQ